jgi:hypothetical protein
MTVPYVNKVGTAKKAHFMKLLFRQGGLTKVNNVIGTLCLKAFF